MQKASDKEAVTILVCSLITHACKLQEPAKLREEVDTERAMPVLTLKQETPAHSKTTEKEAMPTAPPMMSTPAQIQFVSRMSGQRQERR